MTWDLSEDERQYITNTEFHGESRKYAEDTGMGGHVFRSWAEQVGGQSVLNIVEFVARTESGNNYEELANIYLKPGAQGHVDIEWDTSKFKPYDEAYEDAQQSVDFLVAEWRDDAVEWLDEKCVPNFLQDVQQVKDERPAFSDPEPIGVPDLTPDKIDRDFIDRLNEATLKDLPEARNGEHQAPVWVLWDIVMIGDKHPQNYRDMAERQIGPGSLYISAKGSTFSAGEIKVSGVGTPSQQYVKDAIKRVSKKSVKFI